MKRSTAVALAAAAVAFALAGCSGSDESSSDANELSKGTTSTSTSATSPTSSAATAPEPAEAAPTTGESQPDTASLGPASRTTCAEFKKLDSASEKSVIEQAIAENPGGPFEGSPNVALGTAKLVCLSGSYADTPVAVAAGIVAKDN